MDKTGNWFFYITRPFSVLSRAKIKAGIFEGPQFRILINDENFLKYVTIVESAAWTGFLGDVRGFLSGSKNENYKQLVDNMLTSFHSLGARMSVKVHILFSHLEKFPENPVNVSEEQGERFHRI